MVDDYLSMKPDKVKQKREDAKAKLQSLLETPELLQALALERDCEEMEIEIARALFPFTEMGRILEHKRGKLVPVPGVIDDDKVLELQELLRVRKIDVFATSLRTCLCSRLRNFLSITTSD